MGIGGDLEVKNSHVIFLDLSKFFLLKKQTNNKTLEIFAIGRMCSSERQRATERERK